jgi:hypothetical protein
MINIVKQSQLSNRWIQLCAAASVAVRCSLLRIRFSSEHQKHSLESVFGGAMILCEMSVSILAEVTAAKNGVTLPMAIRRRSSSA